MRFLCVLFLTAVPAALAAIATMKSVVFPRETNTDRVELAPLQPLNLRAFTLCMRVATELTGQREVILFAYRTQYYDELNLWREAGGRLSLYLSSSEVVAFNVPQLGALETHLCVTWDSSTGATALFMDGRKSLTKIYRQGHSVRSGGKVVIGQDFDSYEGDFDASQSFVGEMSDVNLWDSVLSESTIQDLSSGKATSVGNVLDWGKEFKASVGVVILNREL
ncbi:pentraxin fusion protein-like [Scomber japonicus]|uniref:pentraxin fusion protein-like n=1 Tax=Scomber japonicus TaxID=13676 RepID=UPI0023064644|nr:pentraxin fusion protein-like [Scomber japonicus]XP_053194145.1 pentraxin fusion protein-like [Scomber japonicus]